jgi:hypothetical protein
VGLEGIRSEMTELGRRRPDKPRDVQLAPEREPNAQPPDASVGPWLVDDLSERPLEIVERRLLG